MPELPEVETVARGVDARARGDVIESVWFSEKKEPFKSPPQQMAAALPGRRIEAVRRVGKHIVFDLSGPSAGAARFADEDSRRAPWSIQLIVHLGMTGRLLVSDASAEVPRHTHAILRLASGREIRFVDARRFGRMGLHPPDAGRRTAPGGGFVGTGREPLEIDAAEFALLFRRRRTPIKAALLNQTLLHGVGNIYADEALFRAGIRPRRMAGRLSRAELARLHAGVQQVLREAIASGGSSVSDYVDAAGVRGFFQLEHRVYMRTSLPCLVCGTAIRRIVVAGRGTHYCPNCQR